MNQQCRVLNLIHKQTLSLAWILPERFQEFLQHSAPAHNEVLDGVRDEWMQFKCCRLAKS